MLVKVAVLGDDDRYKLSDFNTDANPPADMKLSPEEMKQIRSSTGFVACKFTRLAKDSGTGKDEVAYETSSATLVGDSGHLLMAGHGLFDKKTKKPIQGLSGCVFVNHDNPPQKIPLAAKDIHQNAVVRMNKDFDLADGEDSKDYALVKLKSPVSGGKPFPVDLAQHKLKRGDQLLTISAYGAEMAPERTDLTQPVAQICSVKDIEHRSSDVVYTDCDVKPGQSGSVQMIRDAGGRLVVKAMVVSEAVGEDGAEYNFVQGHFTSSIGVDGSLLRDIREIFPQIGVGNGAVDSP